MHKPINPQIRNQYLSLGIAAIFIILISTGCSSAAQPLVATPIPDEYIPTIIAQTAAASIQLTAMPAQETALAITPSAAASTVRDTLTSAPEEASADLDETATAITPPSAIESIDATAPPIVPELIDEAFTPPTLVADTSLPPAEIKIYRPGDLSRVVSPFSVVANMPPGQNGQVQLELVGEDGRTLANLVQYIIPLPNSSTANVVVDIKFEIPGVAEAGRLQFTLRDDNGRVKAISSVNLVLLSQGRTELNGYGDLRQNVVIRQPAEGTIIEGGTFLVSGAARTGDERSLVIELIDLDGKVVGSGLAALEQPLERNFYTYSTEIKYKVSEETPVRMVVRARGARIPGTAFLNSVELVLLP